MRQEKPVQAEMSKWEIVLNKWENGNFFSCVNLRVIAFFSGSIANLPAGRQGTQRRQRKGGNADFHDCHDFSWIICDWPLLKTRIKSDLSWLIIIKEIKKKIRANHDNHENLRSLPFFAILPEKSNWGNYWDLFFRGKIPFITTKIFPIINPIINP